MTLEYVKKDITKMDVECIVNAANESLLGGGGVDGAIYKAAGPKLLKECETLGGCETGDAKITKGYNLKAKYVIHTVGPIYKDGKHNEKKLLTSCYTKSLEIAKEYKIKSIAFPLISAGAYGYPKDKALSVATNAIKKFFSDENADIDMKVFIVVYDKVSFDIGKKRYKEMKEFIDDFYDDSLRSSSHINSSEQILLALEDSIEKQLKKPRQIVRKPAARKVGGGGGGGGCGGSSRNVFSDALKSIKRQISDTNLKNAKSDMSKTKSFVEDAYLEVGSFEEGVYLDAESFDEGAYLEIDHLNNKYALLKNLKKGTKLKEIISNLDCSFSEALLKIIDKKGYKDADVYRRANVDRKLFAKIRKNDHYHPKKETAVAFCIALKLGLEESNQLLSKAGYVLTCSEKFDVIVMFHIIKKIYDIDEINQVLFAYDQPLMGVSK